MVRVEWRISLNKGFYLVCLLQKAEGEDFAGVTRQNPLFYAGLSGKQGNFWVVLLERRARSSWQRERKTGTFSWWALDSYLTPVGLDDLFDDSQAQPGATGGAGAGGIRAIEALKEVWEMFGRNAVSGILHAYFDQCFAGNGGETDFSMAGGMGDGIA